MITQRPACYNTSRIWLEFPRVTNEKLRDIHLCILHLFKFFFIPPKAFRVLVGDVPPAADHWRDDSFYGAHYLNGCNPEIIKRCTEIPSKFPVTQELVGNLLDEGDTLHKAIEVG